MPWRTVLENIPLPLELTACRRDADARASPRDDRAGRAGGLRGQLAARPLGRDGPARGASARALIHDPDLLLLDEPFGSLDALTRERMWTELSRIWQGRHKTVVMVTHSISEALFLADRVLVLTAAPRQVKLDLKVDLPRPRLDEMRYTPHFGELARKLKAAIG